MIGERLIATDRDIQNNTAPADTLPVMRERRLVEPIDYVRLDREGATTCYTDDKSDDNRNTEGENNTEDQNFDLRQKKKTLHAPNAKYFNSDYNLLK